MPAPDVTITLPSGATTLVCEADKELADLHWWQTRAGYVARWFAGRHFFYLHRLVLERALGRSLGTSEVADHVSGDILDNRRPNLRAASPSQSMMNRRKQAGKSSRYIGVNHVRGKPHHTQENRPVGTKVWRAYLKIRGRYLCVGYFDSEIEAAVARDVAARYHYGEYARLNNVAV